MAEIVQSGKKKVGKTLEFQGGRDALELMIDDFRLTTVAGPWSIASDHELHE